MTKKSQASTNLHEISENIFKLYVLLAGSWTRHASKSKKQTQRRVHGSFARYHK